MSVNVVIAGHVDHGKSTLIGRLLYDSDAITDGRVEEIQSLAQEYKRRFEFAYFLDSFEDELEEERTIDTTAVMFKGRNLYSVTDVPGHKEFIKNMLTGASHADVAVLVVAADEGIQEQTKRHAFLIHMLGIRPIFVVVNKMDAVGYEEDVFHRTREELAQALVSFGYRDVKFIPASATEGDNIYKPSERMEWYSGPTLIEALDGVELTQEAKPLRFVVQDVYMVGTERVIAGRVESGTLRKSDEVIFQPSNARGRVEKVRVFDGDLDKAGAGDSIGVVTNCKPKRGDVCGLQGSPPLAVNEFLGEAFVLDNSLSRGEVIQLKCATQKVRCEIKDIREKIDSETGAVVETHPDRIKEGEAAAILFATEPLVVEKFSDMAALGRFVLVRDNRDIGAGVVLEVSK